MNAAMKLGADAPEATEGVRPISRAPVSSIRGPVPPEQRDALLKLIDEIGEDATLAELQLSKMGLYRAMSGLSVNASTRLALRTALARRGVR